ncbi:DnaD domain protein [Aerococcus urinae]
MNPWEKLNPREPLKIILTQIVSNADLEVLTYLYQPIIGAEAFALYMTLYAYIDRSAYQSEVINHGEIMDQLVFSKERYVRSRRRLEAIGLLRSYTQQSGQAPVQALYQLLAPVSSEQFFKDSLMTSLLLDHVGEVRFNRLLDRFSFEKIADSQENDWQEVTATFQDVFHLSQSSRQLTESEKQSLLKKPSKSLIKTSLVSDFDIAYFTELVQRSFLSERAVSQDVKEMTQSLHALYGLDEVALSQFAIKASNVRTNQVDINYYQGLVIKAMADQPINKRPDYQMDQAKQQTESQGQDLPKENQDEASLALIKAAKAYPPLTFAKTIKEQKNGYLTTNEIKTLEMVMNKGLIDGPTLNIMIHYYLISQESSSIVRSTFERTVDDWSQKNIQSPEQALTYLNKRTKRIQKQRQSKNKRQNAKRKTYQELQPAWFNQKQETADKEEKMDHESVQALADRIRALNSEEGDE